MPDDHDHDLVIMLDDHDHARAIILHDSDRALKLFAVFVLSTHIQARRDGQRL